MFKKLRTVIYYVPDLQAAKDWYSKLTGVQPYFDEAFYVGFDFNGCDVCDCGFCELYCLGCNCWVYGFHVYDFSDLKSYDDLPSGALPDELPLNRGGVHRGGEPNRCGDCDIYSPIRDK